MGTKRQNKKKRIILHIDMDHFFSAVEERENPAFKGKPVVVGADPKDGEGRGVVKTCNYTAREFGIHSGMPISKAWRLCPTAIYVRANYQLYKQVSKGIMTILKRFSNKFQQWGFDEAFLDISSQVESYEDASKLAENIKDEILENERLTCSIGVAPNKLVAKIASDYGKPDGLTVVTEDAVERFLAPLPVRRLIGVGEKTEGKLNKMGIKTIGDLAACDVSLLIEKHGTMGARFHQFAHGIYESKARKQRSMIKSIGHETTFMEDINDCDFILKKMDNLCTRIHEKITRRKIAFKTVTVKIRYENFETYTHRKTFPRLTNHLGDLRGASKELAQDLLRADSRIRLIGIRISNLSSRIGQQTLA